MDNTVGSPLSISKGDPVTTESRPKSGRNRLEKSSYYTPASVKERNIPEYISGYVGSTIDDDIV